MTATTPKMMDIAEFSRLGYLQELNRQFLHPLGMALAVGVNADGSEYLDGIWDCRDDPEGIIFGIDGNNLEEFSRKADLVMQHKQKIFQDRYRKLGFGIQPLKPVVGDVVDDGKNPDGD